MKNFKLILTTILIDYIYCLLTFLFSFVVAEYIVDISTDFERFKSMHSLTDNIYFILIFLAWVFLTVFIIKYTKRAIKLINKKESVRIFKNKKILVITVCIVALLITSCLVINNQEIKPPRLYLSSEFSKTVQAVQGGYSWSKGNKSVIADSIHPTEFQYTAGNTLTVERSSQLILSNKKIKFDRRYYFELLNFECFDKNNKVVEDYKVFPTYSNGDLYINAPSLNGVYICSAILKYGQNTAGYGYKLIVADDEARANTLYTNKTDYVGNNSKVSAIAHNLTVPIQLGWDGMELQTEKEPYGLTINYLITDEDLGKIDLNNLQNNFPKNAMVMFSLIENVENITINLKQGEEITTSNYSRKMADEYMGQDVRNFAQTEDSFKAFLAQLYLGK